MDRGDDALRLGEDAQPRLGIVVDTFLVERVGILADREIEGALDAGEMHVGLHLRPVQRLGRLDALGLQLGEGLVAMGLELADMPGLRRFGEAGRHRIHAAAEVAAGIAHVPLPPGPGIEIEHGDADPPQIGDEARLSQVPGLEQPEQPSRVADPGCPAERIPQRTIAPGADQGGTEMLPPAGIGRRLVGGIDGRDRGRGGGRESDHNGAASARPPPRRIDRLRVRRGGKSSRRRPRCC